MSESLSIKDVSTELFIFYIFLLDWTSEMVCEKFTSNVNTVFYQSSEAIHPISFPFSFIVTSFRPLINS